MERSDWQLRLSTHKKRCKYAFDNSLFCDVEFVVVDCDGNKVTVPANKYPLAVCSPVFEAMFYGKLAETKSPIHIPDCTKEGLQEILRYAHYEEAKLTGSNVMEVLYLAKKYMIPSLEAKCQDFIHNEVGPKDVLAILPQVQHLVDENLEKHLWEIVDKNTEQVISSRSFLDISRDLLCQVLKRDVMEVNELNLFKSVDKWVTKRIEEDKKLVCNDETKRMKLGEDIIRLIRFPLMTQKEFVEVVLPSEVLDMKEVTELISIFSGVAPTTKMFSQTKRSRSGMLLISDYRFQGNPTVNVHGLGLHAHICNFLAFTVNKAVNLVGVRMFGSRGTSYGTDLSINSKRSENTFGGITFVNNSHQCMSKISSTYTTEEEMIDGLYYGFTVTLDKPCRLEPGVVYSIQVTISGPDHFVGNGGRRVVSAGDEITITYTDTPPDFNYGYSSTTATSGQFPSLVLQLIK